MQIYSESHIAHPADRVFEVNRDKLDEIDEWVLSGGASQNGARKEGDQER